MSIYWDEARQAWRWQFKAVIDGERHRLSRLLPRGWSEAQSRRYDEAETARTYARLAAGRRASTVPLIERAVGLYLSERVVTLRDATNIGHNLKHLLPHIAGKGLDQLGAVSRIYAAEHRALAPATVRQRLAALRAAATYALKKHGLGSRDWIEQMTLPAVNNARHEYLTRAEVLRLARAIKDRPTRAWVLLTFATGSRPGELYRSTPTPAGMLLPQQKNGEREMKPVLPRFARYMRHWPLPHDYSWHSRAFREARDRLGLKITPHGLRHSTASALMNRGATLPQIGRVLGHKSVQATNRYAHLYTEEKERLLAGIWQKRPHKKGAA